MNTLPKSPEDMPMEFHNSDQIRNCLVTLGQFKSADIHWEMDVEGTNRDGETVGQWEVLIETNGHLFEGKHRCITNALWYAIELAEAHDTEAYHQREKVRADALAKLSADEKNALGLE